jgi:GntR family transcriptional repressor for pyruvate dehydrogenase complex
MSQKQRPSKMVIKQTLADQVVYSLKESILEGEWLPGEALPTEPELSELFGVSRAVVRDATRMLAAQGLVEAQHGKGVFVTESQTTAFGDALLLALRRDGATVWDVEHFEQILYPEIFALVAEKATDEEIANLHQATEDYLKIVQEIHMGGWQEAELPAMERERLLRSYHKLMKGIFRSTHNYVIQLLAEPLLRLRNLRSWQDEKATPETTIEMEKAFIQACLDAIDSRDPDQAREMLQQLMRLPAEAEEVMRKTQVGQIPVIQIDWNS